MFSVDPPSAGDKRELASDGSVFSSTSLTEGVNAYVANVRHVTDTGSINGSTIDGDQIEDDFDTFEAGETYRAAVWLMRDRSYTNSLGGKVYFADSVSAIELELRTKTNDSSAGSGVVIAYVYFTVPEEEQPAMLMGDVNGDGTVDVLDAALVQKYSVGKTQLENWSLKQPM